MRRQAIGVMTGTSMDGIDAVLIEESVQPDGSRHLQRLAGHSAPLAPALRARLLACQCTEARIDDMLRVQKDYTLALLPTLLELKQHADPRLIDAVGVHGQTIRHWPHEGITLQLLDPTILAEELGLDIVSDFRRRDMAAGGQGAPLVPPFHSAMLGPAPRPAAVLNLGGFANLSLVGTDGQALLGFDTGPGNALMDAWIHRCRGESMDAGGAWAAQGQPIDALLRLMLAHPDLQKTGPHSTGRDAFHLGWLLGCLHTLGLSEPLPAGTAADVQATLLALTVATVARGMAQSPWPCQAVYVCGGGARNTTLMRQLQAALSPQGDGPHLHTTDALGWDPQEVEAAAFAWLALRYQAGEAGNAMGVTGAHGIRRLGSLTPGANPTH